MTTPIERLYAVRNTREFLLQLLNPKETPRTPMSIRKRAGELLKHYPTDFDMGEVFDKINAYRPQKKC